MIAALLVVAVFATLALIGSSMATISRVTATDGSGRGPWGVLDWRWERTRRLDAHERRWQTALIAAGDQQTRWPDLLAEIRRLERAAQLDPDPDPPTAFDADWLERHVARIEGACTE